MGSDFLVITKIATWFGPCTTQAEQSSAVPRETLGFAWEMQGFSWSNVAIFGMEKCAQLRTSVRSFRHIFS